MEIGTLKPATFAPVNITTEAKSVEMTKDLSQDFETIKSKFKEEKKSNLL